MSRSSGTACAPGRGPQTGSRGQRHGVDVVARSRPTVRGGVVGLVYSPGPSPRHARQGGRAPHRAAPARERRGGGTRFLGVLRRYFTVVLSAIARLAR